MRGHFISFSVAILLSVALNAATAKTTSGILVVYVDSNAVGANDGSNWENAYNDLQDALDPNNTSAPAEIWVASGVYRPVEPETFGSPTITEREKSFHLRNGIAIYGGFSGGETQLDQRDWEANPTVLSGDIANSSDTDVNGIVTSPSGLGGGNSYSVIVSNDTAANAVLDGFVVTGGWANGDGSCSLVGINRHGGGIFNQAGNPVIRNSMIVGNEARCNGGAIYNVSSGRPTLSNVLMSSNSANYGGGIYTSGSISVVDAILIDNRASQNGGAIYCNAGTMALTNTVVTGNRASNGGGIYNNGNSSTLINVVIASNRVTSGATGSSGGVHSATNAQIYNSIIWGNQRGTEVGSANASITGSPIVRYSLIQGRSPEGEGNFDCSESCPDPRFVETLDSNLAPSPDGNFRLGPGSPAIDAGNNAFVEVDFDLDGFSRIQNDIVDLGPYESEGPLFYDRFEE